MRKTLGLIAVALAAAIPYAFSAGIFSFPSTTAPLTGIETVPMDTNLASGLNPATSIATTGQLASLAAPSMSPRNLLRNGDISVNPFQRGASQAADITTALTYGADGFAFISGTGTAINWSSQTGATDIVANQFTKSFRFQRKSGQTGVVLSCQVNVLTSQDSVALQGKNFVYSFWAKAGANFSPTNGNITVTVASGTGTDQSAASFQLATWTGQTNSITSATDSAPTVNIASVTAAVATFQVLPTGTTAAWTQYWVAGSIATTATQVGTEICFTPIGTAGANDWVETSNHQLEIVSSGVTFPSAFEHHAAAFDLLLAQRHLYRITESATSATMRGSCTNLTSSIANCIVPFPVPMRAVPTMTYATGFGIAVAAQTSMAACTANATSTTATSAASNLSVLMSCATGATGGALGTSTTWGDSGGTGTLTASAEL